MYFPERKRRYNPSHASATKKLMSDDKKNKSAWSDFTYKCRRMWPFIWPSHNGWLQLRVLGCILLLACVRAINVLIPLLQKQIVNSLSERSGFQPKNTATTPAHETTQTLLDNSVTPQVVDSLSIGSTAGILVTSTEKSSPSFCWEYIVIFMVLKTMQGESGYLSIVRSFLWIRVSQDTRKRMRVKLFAHLHNLSLRWHLQRRTGEVLRVMDRGVNSINSVLSQVLFNLVPVIADIIIAVVFFVTIFDVWTGVIILVTMLGYGAFTIGLSEWRTKYRRRMNDASNEQDQASVDSILNFETVKYHAAEDFEVQRFADAVEKHLVEEWNVTASLNLLNFMQKTMMSLGLLGGSLICAWTVYTGRLTIGDYVLFVSYVEQLYSPLNMLGMYYRMMQQAFIDMENMFDMLEEKQEVLDEPDAKALEVKSGEIRFENVYFDYGPEKPLIRNMNLTVPPGKTYALVGPSGGGKSSILKLLLRFYDVKSGSIKIDGVDISMVTQRSLRHQIGVVPQDTVLFNQNIGYNIRYGKPEATDEEIQLAAQSADIAKFIASLELGYDTMVGERGLKLSGGEKQRIAIARTILKAPRIVLLDEATSALDTRTERNIQAALTYICHNRTSIVVAHRLSTVISADQILVVDNGQIVERGCHDDLLAQDGIYAGMWQEQLRAASERTAPLDDTGDRTLSGNPSRDIPELVRLMSRGYDNNNAGDDEIVDNDYTEEQPIKRWMLLQQDWDTSNMKGSKEKALTKSQPLDLPSLRMNSMNYCASKDLVKHNSDELMEVITDNHKSNNSNSDRLKSFISMPAHLENIRQNPKT